MPKHIGIVGVSSEGAALCYRTICQEGEGQHGYAHPEVTLHTFPFSDYMRSIEAEDWPAVGQLLLASAGRLARVGAAFAICPDNTVHQGLNLVRQQSPIPWLHIGEEIGILAARRGYRKVGLLGTRWLMEGPVYPGALAEHGIACEIPESGVRQRISAYIMDELVFGRFRSSTRGAPRSNGRAFRKSVISPDFRSACRSMRADNEGLTVLSDEWPAVCSYVLREVTTMTATELLDCNNLAPGSLIDVETKSRHYHIECLGGTAIRVSGHPDYCPDPVPAKLQGSVDKDGMLEVGFIGCGMRMILMLDESHPITTSQVLNVQVEQPESIH